ncbi:Protein of unknown function [Parapedobacter composti]|uniref:DUF2490 domain-containing protein n=1 Tax=Parapedobacter composti TaxID=623281 RepID=A0A1I1J145_9SPHI|nr:DUF2490 domain-containing protein [Parapedobacter composti]SFC41712.1 Protein of unknown function [Parapedobacter composti]
MNTYLPIRRFTRPLVVLAFCLQFFPYLSHGQNHTYSTWAAWFNNVKFSEKWGLNNDIQFRAGKNWRDNSLLLIRPGINYYINNRQTAAFGYATTLVTNALAPDVQRLTEHRIWEQYIISGKLLSIPVQHRFRLEQRFLKRTSETAFTQRARYFIRGIIPFSGAGMSFSRGAFVSLQNELFFNIQNLDAVNGKLFDQNRAYASIGYRLSPKYDVEVGYMNQLLIRPSSPNTMNHIGQIAIYTRL